MYLSRRFFIAFALVILVIAAGWWWLPLFTAGKVLLALLALEVAVETALLWFPSSHASADTKPDGEAKSPKITAERHCAERFSNGDDNEVTITLKSRYRLPVSLEVIDEAPVEFQRRDLCFKKKLLRQGLRKSAKPITCTFSYTLRPVRRGEYSFGRIRVFASLLMGFVQRRFSSSQQHAIKVYPSYLMLRQYELLAFTHHLTEMGIKRIRRPGNNTEFEQIKDYAKGDDYRSINWKATARRSRLMVNVYNQERSQQVWCVIDKGRMMQQTFDGMTCLDYAINATLVLSFVAVNREDKAGLVTFSTKVDTFIPAARQDGQMETLQESLYNQKTEFGEPDYSALVASLEKNVTQRSLVILFSNFATAEALRRQIVYLRQIARHHRLLVVFFRDDEIEHFAAERPRTREGYYQHVIAEQAISDKETLAATLNRQGIQTLLVHPQDLSVSVINKYLAMRG